MILFILGIYAAGTLFFLWMYEASERMSLWEHLYELGATFLWPIGIVVAIIESIIQTIKYRKS